MRFLTDSCTVISEKVVVDFLAFDILETHLVKLDGIGLGTEPLGIRNQLLGCVKSLLGRTDRKIQVRLETLEFVILLLGFWLTNVFIVNTNVIDIEEIGRVNISIHIKIRKETHPSLVGEMNCASYNVVVVVNSNQFLVTDRVS